MKRVPSPSFLIQTSVRFTTSGAMKAWISWCWNTSRERLCGKLLLPERCRNGGSFRSLYKSPKDLQRPMRPESFIEISNLRTSWSPQRLLRSSISGWRSLDSGVKTTQLPTRLKAPKHDQGRLWERSDICHPSRPVARRSIFDQISFLLAQCFTKWQLESTHFKRRPYQKRYRQLFKR